MFQIIVTRAILAGTILFLPVGAWPQPWDFKPTLQVGQSVATSYFARGVRRARLGDYNKALADYNRAIELNPQYAAAYCNRGTLKQDNIQDDIGALTDRDRAVQLDPLQRRSPDYHAALVDYDRAIQLNPQYALAYNNRGVLKKKNLQDYNGALADYDRAIQLDPQYALAYNNRGVLRSCLQDYNGALADYDRAIQLNPQDPLIYSNRGILKQDLQDYNGALADYDCAIRLNPRDADAYYNRAKVWEKLGKPDKAKESRRKATFLVLRSVFT
jgi:tetratricopeptide (TPR) repeat protein